MTQVPVPFATVSSPSFACKALTFALNSGLYCFRFNIIGLLQLATNRHGYVDYVTVRISGNGSVYPVAIGDQCLAGDEAGALGKQMEHCLGHFPRLAGALQKCCLAHRVSGRLVHGSTHVGLDQAGGQAVDADVGSKRLGAASSKGDHRGSGGAVGQLFARRTRPAIEAMQTIRPKQRDPPVTRATRPLNLLGYIPRRSRRVNGGQPRYPVPWGGVGFIVSLRWGFKPNAVQIRRIVVCERPVPLASSGLDSELRPRGVVADVRSITSAT